jgi:ribosomal protein RSM22 (predicted rRNA methylase)
MKLPSSLQAAIERETESVDVRQLAEAREELTRRYRQPTGLPCMTTEAQRQAYVFSRLPATYAALDASMQAMKGIADWRPTSLLDLGAGPGTAMWAACENFPTIEKVTLIEQDHLLSAIGKRLAQQSDHAAVRSATWETGDLEQIKELPPHDLIILSYCIGELKPDCLLSLIDLSWKAAGKLLLIVEPGTPAGFERIRLVRSHLITRGAHLAAPCPHALACPMAGGDWCHFAARVERTVLHRKLKGGSLGYEDEKFSYVAVSKESVELPSSRVLSAPARHSGHVALKLCTKGEGLQHPIISKKRGDLYKQARKAEWGSALAYDRDV